MDKLSLGCFIAVFECRGTATHSNSFDRYDAVRVFWKRGTCHDFYAVSRLQAGGRFAGHLRALDGEFSHAVRVIRMSDGDSVHHDAIEWGLVALGNYRLPQDTARDRITRDSLGGKFRHCCQNLSKCLRGG